MKRAMILICFVVGIGAGFAMDGSKVRALSLEECYELAQKNYPLVKQYDLVDKSEKFTLAVANRAYLPQLTLGAKGTYQSDVVTIPLPEAITALIDIPIIDKDSYGVTLDVNQMIWDGGVVASQKEIARAEAEGQRQRLEVEIYAIKERVNQLYFGVLLLDAQNEQNDVLIAELNRSYELVSNYQRFGMADESDLDVVRVEQIRADQAATNINHMKKSFTTMLCYFIGVAPQQEVRLARPTDQAPVSDEIFRPELSYYTAQQSGVDAKRRRLNASTMPRFGLFATAGYGKPGLNMLKSDLDTYYMVGVNLSWNIGAFYTKKSNKHLLDVERKMIDNQRELFLFNTNMDVSNERREIERQREIVKSDDQIIALRARIKRSAEAKLANGAISVDDLIREVNAESMAMQTKSLHEIELLQSIYRLKHRVNN